MVLGSFVQFPVSVRLEACAGAACLEGWISREASTQQHSIHVSVFNFI